MIVIFIDILGSREMNSFEEKYKIHKIFHESIKENQSLQDTEAKENVAYTRKLFSFSDCAYIFYHYKQNIDDAKKDLNKLFQVALSNTSSMTLELLNEGYLIRGGITYGQAYYDELSFFGPAVEDAYLIESKQAVTPRILIDSQFGNEIFNFEQETYKKVFGPLSPHYNFLPKRSYIPTIVVSDSDKFILNYFYILEMEGKIDLGKSEISDEKIKNNITKIIKIKIENHKDDEKILEKLIWMKQYVQNSRLSLKDDSYSVTQTV